MNIGLFSNSGNSSSNLSEKSKSMTGGPLSLEKSASSHDDDNMDMSPRLNPKTKATFGTPSSTPKSPSGALGSSGKSMSESIVQFGRKFSLVGMMKSNSIGAELGSLVVGDKSDHGQSIGGKLAGVANGSKDGEGN